MDIFRFQDNRSWPYKNITQIGIRSNINRVTCEGQGQADHHWSKSDLSQHHAKAALSMKESTCFIRPIKWIGSQSLSAFFLGFILNLSTRNSSHFSVAVVVHHPLLSQLCFDCCSSSVGHRLLCLSSLTKSKRTSHVHYVHEFFHFGFTFCYPGLTLIL